MFTYTNRKGKETTIDIKPINLIRLRFLHKWSWQAVGKDFGLSNDKLNQIRESNEWYEEVAAYATRLCYTDFDRQELYKVCLKAKPNQKKQVKVQNKEYSEFGVNRWNWSLVAEEAQTEYPEDYEQTWGDAFQSIGVPVSNFGDFVEKVK